MSSHVMCLAIVLRFEPLIAKRARIDFRFQVLPLNVFSHVAPIAFVAACHAKVGAGAYGLIVRLFGGIFHT